MDEPFIPSAWQQHHRAPARFYWWISRWRPDYSRILSTRIFDTRGRRTPSRFLQQFRSRFSSRHGWHRCVSQHCYRPMALRHSYFIGIAGGLSVSLLPLFLFQRRCKSSFSSTYRRKKSSEPVYRCSHQFIFLPAQHLCLCPLFYDIPANAVLYRDFAYRLAIHQHRFFFSGTQ